MKHECRNYFATQVLGEKVVVMLGFLHICTWWQCPSRSQLSAVVYTCVGRRVGLPACLTANLLYQARPLLALAAKVVKHSQCGERVQKLFGISSVEPRSRLLSKIYYRSILISLYSPPLPQPPSPKPGCSFQEYRRGWTGYRSSLEHWLY